MKKTIWLLFSFIFIDCIWANATPDPKLIGAYADTTCCNLATRVGADTVRSRRDSFRIKKHDAKLDNILNDSLIFSKKAFLNMLTRIASDSGYDGLRVYLAAFPDSCKNKKDSACEVLPEKNEGPLELIFVPTVPGQKGKKRHIDDSTHYWVMSGDTAATISLNNAQSLVDKAWKVYLNKFQNSDAAGDGFLESRSLWYSIALMTKEWPKDTTTCSVLQYLKCSKDSTNSIIVYLVSFEHYKDTLPNMDVHDFFYQLTLLFRFNEIQSKSDNASVTASFANADLDEHSRKRYKNYKPANKKEQRLDIAGTYSDTGKPCPPPGCNGATATHQ